MDHGEGSKMTKHSPKFIIVFVQLIGLGLLYYLSTEKYPVFHLLTEFFSIVIGITIFLITFNSSRFLKNNYLISVGIAFLFIAILDVFHALSMPDFGLGIVPESHSIQLWIAARFFESTIFLFSFVGFRRKQKIRVEWLLLLYFTLTVLIFASVYIWQNFPIQASVSYTVTTVTIFAESLIIVMLLASLIFLNQYQDKFEASTLRYLRIAFVLTILSEFAFAVQGATLNELDLVGHFFKIVAYYFIYKVMIVKVIDEPQEIIFRELSKEKELVESQNALLQNLAVLDGLTGLHNHRYLYERLTEQVKHFHRYRTYFSVLMIDIDHFKNINDTFGHLTGDEILRSLAHVLRRMVRETDLVGRYGGEEFLLILEAANETFAFKIAEKIRVEVENYTFPENIRVTVSIGVSTYAEGKTVNELVDQADKSLYEAKRRGRNRTVSVTNGDIITITNFIEKLPE